MHGYFFIIPFVAALVGWGINCLLIQLLFHPLLPKKIVGFTFQGIISKQQKIIAAQIGKYVQEEIFSLKMMEETLNNPDNIKKILPVIEEKIDHFLRKKLMTQMPMIGMLIGDKTILQFKTIFMEELTLLFPTIINQYVQNIQENLNIEKIISQKISNISLDKLEKEMQHHFNKEFNTFKLIGAAAGFMIGIIQLLFTLMLY